VLSIFTQAAIEVCEGQQYDMNYETVNDVSIPEYIEMIRLKTGVLIAASLKTGAVVAGASKEDVNNIYKFGECVGLAFQLKDDLLDVYGVEDTFGKQIGGDIMTNKKTYLYIKALQEAKGEDMALLKKYFSMIDVDRDEKVKAVTAIYNKLNVKEAALGLINEYYHRAQFYFDALTVSQESKTILKKFSDDLMNRDF